MDFLSLGVYQNVELDKWAVRSADFHSASKVHPKTPWIKIAFIFLQWTTNQRENAACGAKTYGKALCTMDFDKIAKIPFETLSNTENWPA